MTPERHLADLSELRGLLRRQQFISLTMGAALILLAFGVLGKRTTTILEPPTRAQAIAITGDRVDSAWLIEMGTYIAHLMLDATPRSIDWQQQQILKWVHPSTYGELQQRMAVAAKRLVEANATTTFWPQQVAPDPDRQRVLLLGHVDTYVNGQLVNGAGRTVAYQASFESKGGRMLLKDWQETPPDDPWLAKALDEQAKADAAKAKEKNRAK
jgi:type IV conjugative transfer system protein TraE